LRIIEVPIECYYITFPEYPPPTQLVVPPGEPPTSDTNGPVDGYNTAKQNLSIFSEIFFLGVNFAGILSEMFLTFLSNSLYEISRSQYSSLKRVIGKYSQDGNEKHKLKRTSIFKQKYSGNEFTCSGEYY
jgi:hypothetical protein